MSAVLALPRIDPRIPQSVLPLGRHRANAGLARFMVDAGVLSAADVPDVWNDALDVCERAMEAWLRRHIGPLRCLSPLFVLTMDEKGASTCCVHEAYASAELVWLEGNQQQWAVGAGLEALERAQPGLGGAILDLLNAQQTTYPLFTPAIACDVVSYLHWSGEDNEEAALDVQCGDDEQERAERREQMITQAMLNEAFPAWAQRGLPRPRHALRPGLELLASGIHDPCLRGIADDALALSRLHIVREFEAEIEGEFIGWGAVLTWYPDDLTARIYDDLVNQAQQGEYCELIGEIPLLLDEPARLSHWRKTMTSRFRAIGLIDRLIYALSAGDWPRP